MIIIIIQISHFPSSFRGNSMHIQQWAQINSTEPNSLSLVLVGLLSVHTTHHQPTINIVEYPNIHSQFILCQCRPLPGKAATFLLYIPRSKLKLLSFSLCFYLKLRRDAAAAAAVHSHPLEFYITHEYIFIHVAAAAAPGRLLCLDDRPHAVLQRLFTTASSMTRRYHGNPNL